MSGALLAGGKSRRMGTDKRGIVFNGQTLVTRVLTVLESLFTEVLIVLAEDDLSVTTSVGRVVTDLIPHCATAGGLFTGLSCAKNDVVFVVACDMPFLKPEVITHMASQVKGVDITVANLTTGIQPLHGFYRKSCLPVLERMIHAKDLTVQHLLDDSTLSIRVLEEGELTALDPHLLSFMNVNTPADLEMARKLLPRS